MIGSVTEQLVQGVRCKRTSSPPVFSWPPWLALPPMEAIALTSSVGRLAKLPGLVLWVDLFGIIEWTCWSCLLDVEDADVGCEEKL